MLKPPLIAFPATSVIPVPLLFRSSRKVPSPEIPFTVTSMVVPEPAEIEAMVPPTVPVVVSWNAPAVTPVTISLKVTR